MTEIEKYKTMRVYTRKYNIIVRIVLQILFISLLQFTNPLLIGFTCATCAMMLTGEYVSTVVCGLIAFVIWAISVISLMSTEDKKINNLIHTFNLCSKKNYTMETVKNKGGIKK